MYIYIYICSEMQIMHVYSWYSYVVFVCALRFWCCFGWTWLPAHGTWSSSFLGRAMFRSSSGIATVRCVLTTKCWVAIRWTLPFQLVLRKNLSYCFSFRCLSQVVKMFNHFFLTYICMVYIRLYIHACRHTDIQTDMRTNIDMHFWCSNRCFQKY